MNNERKRRALDLMRRYYGGIEDKKPVDVPELESVSISGTILNFTTDIVRPLKSLVSHIVPHQSGSGDPSPSNVRPIAGYDSVSVVRTGKNVLGWTHPTTTKNGVTITSNADGTWTLNGTATATTVFNDNGVSVSLKAGTYYFSGVTGG